MPVIVRKIYADMDGAELDYVKICMSWEKLCAYAGIPRANCYKPEYRTDAAMKEIAVKARNKWAA